MEMTQKSYFLMVAKPGFGPGSGASSWIWSRLRSLILDLVPAQEPHPGFGLAPCCEPKTTLKPQKQLLTEHSMCFPSPGIFIAMRCNEWLLASLRLWYQGIYITNKGCDQGLTLRFQARGPKRSFDKFNGISLSLYIYYFGPLVWKI